MTRVADPIFPGKKGASPVRTGPELPARTPRSGERCRVLPPGAALATRARVPSLRCGRMRVEVPQVEPIVHPPYCTDSSRPWSAADFFSLRCSRSFKSIPDLRFVYKHLHFEPLLLCISDLLLCIKNISFKPFVTNRRCLKPHLLILLMIPVWSKVAHRLLKDLLPLPEYLAVSAAYTKSVTCVPKINKNNNNNRPPRHKAVS